MAFMALFGWMFFPLFVIALVLWAAQSVLSWAAAHLFLFNAALAALLVLNLLLFAVLLKVRAKWKREGKRSSFLVRFGLLAGAVWEACAVLFFLACLMFQPIPYLAGLFL